jgi:O-antigen ligase
MLGKINLSMTKFIALNVLALFTPLTYWPLSRWVAFPIYELCFGVLVCLFILELLQRKLTISKFKGQELTVIVFILIIMINGKTIGAWSTASPIMEMLTLFLILVTSTFSRRELETILIVLLTSGLCVSIIGLNTYQLSQTAGVYSTLINPNFLSGYLTLLLPICLSLWIHPKNSYKVFGIVTTSLLGLILVATFTRSGYLSVLAGMVGFALVKERKLLGVILAYIVIFGMIVNPAQGRFVSIGEVNNVLTYSNQIKNNQVPAKTSTLDSRLRLWSYGLREFSDTPLSGIGIGNYQNNLSKYIDTHPSERSFFTLGVEDIHNNYLKLLVETGIVGLLAFLAVLGAWLIPVAITLWRNRNTFGSLEFGTFFGTIAFLIHNLTNSLMFIVPTSYAFWICLAILAKLTLPTKSKEEIIVQGGRINDTSRFTQ